MQKTLETLFVPLARLMVARGVTFRDAAEALKRALVAAARRAGAETDSGLSVLTGLQRRDIVRLRGSTGDGARASLAAQVLVAWQKDGALRDAEGGLRALPRLGPAPSFDALVREIRQDVHPRSVLEAMERQGLAVWDREAEVVLANAQPGLSPRQLRTFEGNLSDHSTAAVANVLGEARHFDRALEYAGLSAEDVKDLEARFSEEMMVVLQGLNAEAERRRSLRPGTHRIRFGGYGYSE